MTLPNLLAENSLDSLERIGSDLEKLETIESFDEIKPQLKCLNCGAKTEKMGLLDSCSECGENYWSNL